MCAPTRDGRESISTDWWSKWPGVTGKMRKRVWIDSQTEEEILRGIREAKDLSAYDNLAASAYLRAKEDYLMGINFSRLLTLKYRQFHCQLSEHQIHRHFRGAGHDLCAGHGCPPGAGDPGICQNAVLSGGEPDVADGPCHRRGIPGGGGLPVLPVAPAL